MSEIGDLYAGHRAARQEKRATNREQSARLLTEAGVQFTAHNGGAHLVVDDPLAGAIDFWPGTGRWTARSGSKGFGVRSLLRHLEAAG